MTVRWITRRIAQAESKWRKKGKFRGHSHVDAVACVGGWRAEPNVAPGVGQCQGGEQTGAPAALRPLQAHQSQEEPEFHAVVRAAGKQHNATQLPTNSSSSFYFALSFVCLILYLFRFFVFFFCLFYLPFIFFFPFFLFSSFFSSRLFVTRYFLFAVAWLWLVPFSFRSSFSRTYFALRFSFFSLFFLFLKRVESRFTAVLGYVTLSVYKGK